MKPVTASMSTASNWRRLDFGAKAIDWRGLYKTPARNLKPERTDERAARPPFVAFQGPSAAKTTFNGNTITLTGLRRRFRRGFCRRFDLRRRHCAW